MNIKLGARYKKQPITLEGFWNLSFISFMVNLALTPFNGHILYLYICNTQPTAYWFFYLHNQLIFLESQDYTLKSSRLAKLILCSSYMYTKLKFICYSLDYRNHKEERLRYIAFDILYNREFLLFTKPTFFREQESKFLLSSYRPTILRQGSCMILTLPLAPPMGNDWLISSLMNIFHPLRQHQLHMRRHFLGFLGKKGFLSSTRATW